MGRAWRAAVALLVAFACLARATEEPGVAAEAPARPDFKKLRVKELQARAEGDFRRGSLTYARSPPPPPPSPAGAAGGPRGGVPRVQREGTAGGARCGDVRPAGAGGERGEGRPGGEGRQAGVHPEPGARREHRLPQQRPEGLGGLPEGAPNLDLGKGKGKGFQMYKPDDLKNWAKTQKGAAKGKAEGGDDGEL